MSATDLGEAGATQAVKAQLPLREMVLAKRPTIPIRSAEPVNK